MGPWKCDETFAIWELWTPQLLNLAFLCPHFYFSSFAWTLNKHNPSMVKTENFCKKILEKIRWEEFFSVCHCYKRWLWPLPLQSINETQDWLVLSPRHKSALLLLLLQLLARPLLLQLRCSCCRRPGLCQWAVDCHGLNAEVKETFKFCLIWSSRVRVAPALPAWPSRWCRQCWWAAGRCWTLWPD